MASNIKDIFANVNACRNCKTISGYSQFPFTSHGNLNSKYLLVSEAPGKDSLTNQKYWVGAGGKILRSCLIGTNKELEDLFYLTDIVKCWPNDNNENRTPFDIEIAACSPFLKSEIAVIKPKLILSFGKKSSEFLLNREINLKLHHGSIFEYDSLTKVLVLFHPSGIDRFMKRDVYTTQLKLVFAKIIENKPEDISLIFNGSFSMPEVVVHKSITPIAKPITPIYSSRTISFDFPAVGNEITLGDIEKNQLRVTADFKNHFPASNTQLSFSHKGVDYIVNFTHRGNRSHILRLGSKLMQSLDLSPGSRVRISKVNLSSYLIEKLS